MSVHLHLVTSPYVLTPVVVEVGAAEPALLTRLPVA